MGKTRHTVTLWLSGYHCIGGCQGGAVVEQQVEYSGFCRVDVLFCSPGAGDMTFVYTRDDVRGYMLDQ
jgi:hypothetical protein